MDSILVGRNGQPGAAHIFLENGLILVECIESAASPGGHRYVDFPGGIGST